MHGGDRLAAVQGARRGDHAGHRRRPLRRARHRHRPLHVREHLGRGAPHGRRADRGRRGAAPGLPAPVGGPSVPPAPAPAARAGERRALRRRHDHDRPPGRSATTRRRARSRPTRRASSTTSARSRARAIAVLVRELLADGPRGHAQGEPAGHRRQRRRIAASPACSAAAGIPRPPASRPPCRIAELVERLREQVREQLAAVSCSTPRTASSCIAKPAGVTSHDVVAAGSPRRCRAATKVGHAGTLDPFATGLLLVLVGRATRAQRFLMGLPKTYRAVARLGWTSDTGDRDGELDRDRAHAGAARDPGGRAAPAPARLLGGEGGGPARLRAGAPRRARSSSSRARSTVYRAELLWHEGDRAAFEIECSAGTYVRALVRRPRRRLLRGARAHRRRAVQARRRRSGAPGARSKRRSPSCPSGGSTGRGGRGGPPRQAGGGGRRRRRLDAAAHPRGRACSRSPSRAMASCSPS